MSNPLQVIDISEPQEKTVPALLKAATEQGFLFVDGHDFTQEEVNQLFDLSKQFFTNTEHEEKKKYAIKSNNIGYTDFSNEQLDPRKARDFKEGYNFGYANFKTGEYNLSEDYFYKRSDKNDPSENPVPSLFKQNEALTVPTMQKLHKTATEILRLIAIALGIEDEDFFTARHSPDEPSGSVFRMLRYPLIRDDGLTDEETKYDPTIRAGAHTDYGALTLLFQREDQQGLELQMDKDSDDSWAKVPYVASKHEGKAPPLVVNFGDLLSYWTNGVLRSTVHRVKFSPGETRTSDRYSIVFFVHPANKTTLDPVPSDLVKKAGNGQNPPAITALDHLKERLADTYSW
ncbi:isopenicillin N synthase family dioxygenase [Kluyveromyces lactis]|uniref:KLLA0D13002p n=1 Tax=Kluyveromyces lactis (strain ATCC 8585 / CBS 2359 / DSM 70799 / NBRC 1267 / NRRL Y-1140 / WM37) TaxID=284590 RepID=Q6CQZ7_KLULA|nr:uncharacterized protein KLLA0_D13002g [Kluyveromyces lactis]CAH00738.1 KLLA0D13002p [Kluyveromyces lactis]|eukprot:XP_453642.1 uncharacterized protein KLLA0_D13002g [Kluyveromyces lactis]